MPRIELEQGIIEYTDDGPRDAPVIVLLHGLLVDGQLWRKVVPLLAVDHRVIAPDLPLGAHRHPLAPGADRSPAGVAQLVADLLAALDVSDVCLGGSDTGGALAQLVAADHPERVGRLALISCDAFEQFPPTVIKPLVRLAARDRLFGAALRGARWQRVWRTPLAFGWLTKRPIDPKVVRSWVDGFTAGGAILHDVAAFTREVKPAVLLDAAERLRAFPRPVLVLWAREDRVFKPELAGRLAALFADARVEWVEDSYAFVSEDQPEVTARALAAFVRAPAFA